jgi:hypothetical protein
MDIFWDNSFTNTALAFINSNPFVWFSLFAVLAIGIALNWLANFIPQLDVLKAKVLLPLARKYRQRKLAKSAIKSDIRGHVNREIAKMRAFLPEGWACDIDVNWVESEEPTTFMDDNRIVVRIRPVEDQDKNFVNATYHFLRTSFFPKTQAVVPKPHYEASVLYVCRKVAEGRNGEAKTFFEDHVMEPMIQRHRSIPTHLDDYALLDAKGFFTGTFLRELHLMAIGARFTGARNDMTQETSGMVKHIKEFIEAYEASRSGGDDIPTTAWYKEGTVANYALLLVANPVKTEHGVDAYINRARERFQSGTKRLYVFGANSEKRFADAVIAGIEGTVENIRLVERFQTSFDYRGSVSGVGAVFESTT